MNEPMACYTAFPGWDGSLMDAPAVVWSLIVSDTLFGLTAIAIGLLVLRVTTSPKYESPMPDVALLFGLFTIACGVTHLMTVVVLFWPAFAGLATAQWIAVALVVLCLYVFLRKYQIAIDWNRANAAAREMLKSGLADAQARLEKIEAEQK